MARAALCSIPLLVAASSVACGDVQHPQPSMVETTSARSDEAIVELGAERLVLLRERLMIDGAATVEERKAAQKDFEVATSFIQEALGMLEFEVPRVVFCKREACMRYFVGDTMRNALIAPHERQDGKYVNDHVPTIVVTTGNVRTILAHELTHVAMGYGRRGLAGKLDAVPAWFAEGVATSLGNAPECTPDLPRGIDDLRKLRTPRAWFDHTNLPGKAVPTYCQAKAEAERWVLQHGKAKFLELLDRVRGGESFDKVYGSSAM